MPASRSTQDPRPTKAALTRGAHARARAYNESQPAALPLLVCGCKSTQSVFTTNYELCDGVMEYDGGAKPWNEDFNFHVPKGERADVGS
jgi:hypothetical protein